MYSRQSMIHAGTGGCLAGRNDSYGKARALPSLLVAAKLNFDTRYFTCRRFMYSSKARMRDRTNVSLFAGSREYSPAWTLYSHPHTGISRVPCDATSAPSITSYSRENGKTPPLFFATTVRSGGAFFNWLTIGPLPFPSTPWQLAQFAWNSYLPKSTLSDFPCANADMPIAANTTVTVSFRSVGIEFSVNVVEMPIIPPDTRRRLTNVRGTSRSAYQYR